MTRGAESTALAELGEAAALLTSTRRRHDKEWALVMAQVTAGILVADRAGVTRSTIIRCSGLSRPTVYQILNDASR